ncbi:sialidase family protein [Polyangium sp. 15x6]|uniref:sialidase family protein n=1 Tax=Polyangium sp. 15x6 TaxID=3042687 RepID=UPI00249C4018|nr:sialidase family protein [Polyangium sp. 15x6]MDI3285586.1 sialidase family protein [Polyangium sp. 15x6]
MLEAIILDVNVISSHPSYHGWPTVARKRDGELLVVSSAGRERHVCPFGQVHMISSRDDGDTWSAAQILLDGPLDDRDAGVLQTRSGTTLVTWFTSLSWMEQLHRQEMGITDWLTPADQARWQLERERVVTSHAVRREMGTWMIRSEDDGRTWSERYTTPVNSPHGPIETTSARLLYAGNRMQPPEKWENGAPHGKGDIAVAESTDDGRTWHIVGAVPYADGHEAGDYHEPHLVDAGGGRLVLHIRNHGRPYAGEIIQSESEDGGRTWIAPRSIGVWGLPSHLMRRGDGRLVMTYGYRRQPYGNHARVSGDGGRTWSTPMTLSDDGTSGDLGYPSTVELGDGRLLTVWYEKPADRPFAVLRQARWSLGE